MKVKHFNTNSGIDRAKRYKNKQQIVDISFKILLDVLDFSIALMAYLFHCTALTYGWWVSLLHDTQRTWAFMSRTTDLYLMKT